MLLALRQDSGVCYVKALVPGSPAQLSVVDVNDTLVRVDRRAIANVGDVRLYVMICIIAYDHAYNAGTNARVQERASRNASINGSLSAHSRAATCAINQLTSASATGQGLQLAHVCLLLLLFLLAVIALLVQQHRY
jgi:hypothetical protein